MSYLSGPEIPRFSKAVISFWCRIPQAAMDAAQAEDNQDPYPDDPPPLFGLVPLVVFGKEGTSRVSADVQGNSEPLTTSTSVTICVEHIDGSLSGDPVVPGSVFTTTYWAECNTSTSERTYYKFTWTYSSKPGKPTNPSFIAVDGYGNLAINFESTDTGDVTLAYNITSATDKYYTQETINACLTFGNLEGCGDFTETATLDGGLAGVLEYVFQVIGIRFAQAIGPGKYIDMGSSPREEHKATSEYGPVPGDEGTGALGNGDFDGSFLTADTWHHVLISVDMSNGSASTGRALGDNDSDTASHITTTSTLYIAIDDVNYLTRDGSPFPGTNKVYTGGAATISGSYQASSYDDDSKTWTPEGPIPSYSLGGMAVPAGEVGLPATGKYVDRIHQVEMAELQMFIGVTKDTSDENVRRAFIDKDGKPTPPAKKKSDKDPTSGSIEFMTKKPDVMLHGSSNWIRGHNTGSIGIGQDGKDIPSGQFTPTAKTKKYKPDPSLHGAQSP